MAPADLQDKKRKRSSKSPVPTARSSFKMATKPADGGQIMPDEAAVAANVQLAKDAFAKALGVSEYALEYEEERTELLNAESKKAWDREATDGASASEKRAGAITRALREYERDVVFGSIPREELPDDDSLDMGGQFLTNKDRIEKRSKVFEIATQVPKGAILHLHFNAELHPRRLLQEARKNEHMRIRSIRPLLTKDDLDKTEMVFTVKPADCYTANLFDPEYAARTPSSHKDKNIEPFIWMKYADFRTAFNKLYGEKYTENAITLPNPEALPNCGAQVPVYLDPAEEWLLEKMVLSEKEAYEPSQTTNGVWARFNQATRLFKGLVSYKQVYTWYISNAIDHLIAEKIMYAELRPMLMDKHIDTDDGIGRITNAGQMELILEAVEAKRKELEKIGKADLFPFGLKIIYCTPRSIPNAKMVEELNDCIDLKVRFPDLICGFDLVGAEDRQNHIGHYYKELVAFQKACKEKNLEIPFMFHAGETLLDTGGSLDRNPDKSNLYDACLLKAKRIGHGFSLLKHPHLVEKFKKTATQPGICIELCPISNELLHLCRNIKEHPYPELLAAGIPCTINSDNPSLFSNSMSHEFYQVLVGAPSMSVHSWKQLALWSLEYSCLSTTEIERGKAIFLASWEEFCKSIVEKYSELGFFKGDTFVVGEVVQNEKGEDVISYDKVKEMYDVNPLPKEELKSNSKPKPETSEERPEKAPVDPSGSNKRRWWLPCLR